MASPRQLVVVIPGIGGSVLERDGEVLWDGGSRRLLNVMRDPSRLRVEPQDGVVATRLIKSTVVVPGVTVLHGYDRLLSRINKVTTREQGASDPVLEFAYDFRRSIQDAAEALEEAVGRYVDVFWPPGDRRGRILVVAHSMGGLVARYWLAVQEHRRMQCRALITLGTPHRGAPKALDTLVNGVRTGRRPLDVALHVALPKKMASLHAVIADWDSMYELLPRYPVVRQPSPLPNMYPHDLDVPELDRHRAIGAFQLHEQIQQAWTDMSDVAMLPYLGTGHPTLESVFLRDGKLSVTKEPATYLDDGGLRGDGTVPAISAEPIEFDDHRGTMRPGTSRHGLLTADDAVGPLLAHFAARRPGPIRHPPDADAQTLAPAGIDLDELYRAHEPIEIFAHPPHGVETREITGRLRRSDGEADADVLLTFEPDGPAWVVQVPPLASGLWELKVQIPGRPPVGDAFAVVEL